MSQFCLEIEKLNLRLPAELAGRANAIGREVARQLGLIQLNNSLQLAQLNVPAIRVSGGETNQVIARRISSSIFQQMQLAQQSMHRAQSAKQGE